MKLLLKSSLLIFVFCLIKFGVTEGDDLGGLSIKLGRQKSPLQQFLNSVKHLKKYGLDFDWAYQDNRTNDSIALYRYIDNEFYAKIVVGSPGQEMNVALDTAWTLSWLMSEECPWTTIGCIAHNKYNHRASSLYKKDGRPISINDGKYNLSGYYSYDTFFVAHSNASGQMFAEMKSVPYVYLFNKIDGILGLGLQFDEYVPFFYTLLQQKKIAQPIFCIYLNRDKQSDHGGNIIMGFIEMRHIHSHKDKENNTIYDPVKYLPVKTGGYWQFDLDSVFINGGKDDDKVFCKSGCTGISDTSSNSIYGPSDQVDQIHEIIGAKPWLFGRFAVACDTINKLPVLGFVLGGQNFTLKGRDYTISMTWHSLRICLSAFVPDNSISNMWVLGGAFLSEYYSIYDIQNKQIGFVKAA